MGIVIKCEYFVVVIQSGFVIVFVIEIILED